MFDYSFLICKLYRQFILISDYGKWHISYLYRFPVLYSSSQNNYYNFRSKSKINLQIFIKCSFCFISTTCFFKENIFYIFFITNSTNGSVRKDMKMVFECSQQIVASCNFYKICVRKFCFTVCIKIFTKWRYCLSGRS